MRAVQNQINAINDRNLNLALGFAAACSILTRIISFSWNKLGIYSPFSLTISALTIVFIIVFLLRKRLTYQAKMYILLFSALIFFCLGLYNRALFSPVLSFLVIVPLIQSYIGSFRLAVTMNIILLVLYLVMGVIVINTPDIRDRNWESMLVSPWIWLTDISIIFTITLATIVIGRANNHLLIDIYNSLEEQRDELNRQAAELRRRKEELEQLVAVRSHELLEANGALYNNNLQIAEKNQEIAWKNEETEKKLAEIRRIEKDLLESDKLASVGVFAHGITRNISAPMAIIGEEVATLTTLATTEGPEQQKTITELTAILDTGVGRLSRVLADLERIGGTDTNERTNLSKIARDAIEATRVTARPNAIINLEEQNHAFHVRGNAARLERIFINLLTNACHALEHKSDGRITIRFTEELKSVIAEVEDNGDGISPDLLKRITEPFFTTKDPGKGTGLGLFLCQSLMADMGGHLDIRSEVGRGTRILLRFPKPESDYKS